LAANKVAGNKIDKLFDEKKIIFQVVGHKTSCGQS
jgi:hypothetical protein